MSAEIKYFRVSFMVLSVGLFAAGITNCFGKDNNQELNKTVIRRLSPDEEETFVSLVNRRRAIREERVVLSRLLEEKSDELTKINNAVSRAFGIEWNQSYRFDKQKHALYTLSLATPASDTEQSVEESLHKRLTERQVELFIRSVKTRENIQVAIQGIGILQKQKQKQWDQFCDELLEKFGIQRNQDYHYDKDKRLIYRVSNTSWSK